MVLLVAASIFVLTVTFECIPFHAMSSRSPLLPVLLFGFIVSATPFQPKNESAMKLSATPNLVTPTFPSNASAPPLNASGENTFNIRCDGETYGYNPNILDCESAKEYIVPDITIFTFGERGTGLPEVVIQLPYRLMGDRGLCYMQAVLVGDHITGKASLNMLRGAAGALVLQCAAGAVSQGGIATGIGKGKPDLWQTSFPTSPTGFASHG